MPRPAVSRFQGLMLLADAAGLLMAAGALSGCPGSLDPSLLQGLSGSGGSTGSGGGTGTGGSTTVDCSGANDGASIIMSTCQPACHEPSTAPLIGGVDLTVDANIGSRLVGVTSQGKGESACGSNSEPYLEAGSNPAKGLLIWKIQTNPRCEQNPSCCGVFMPQNAITPLSSIQQQCITQWATTLTTAAP